MHSQLQPFSQDYNLASKTTYVMCVNFIHKWRETYSLKSTLNDRFFEEPFMAILLMADIFSANEVFFHISFRLTSNKVTHYPTRHDTDSQ